MKNILVIADLIDNPQTALSKAQDLARTTVANIHIIAFCYESLTFTQSEDEGNHVKSMVMSRTRQFWENYFNTHKITTTASYEIVWEKDIVKWLHQHCENTQYDLIVKSGHRSETAFHTPTDWQLFRESHIPVYCVGKQSQTEGSTKKDKTILVALDMVTKNKEKAELNKKLLEAAFQLSIQANASLYCCSAIIIPAVLNDMDLIDVPKRKAQVTEEIKLKAEKLFDNYDVPSDNLIIQQGNAWKVILNSAREIKADCIVLGSMSRQGIVNKLIGNTAEKVIHYTDSDLLVISPQ